jgi:signal transduction histidine kinase
MTSTLAMPMPPTRSATAPRPSRRAVSASSAAALAASASDGRVTWTSDGVSGLAVAASTERTSSTWSGSVRTRTVDGASSMPNRVEEGAPVSDAQVELAALSRAEAGRPRRVPVVVAGDGVTRGSSAQLGRVVANLVDNAARHARTNVRVTVDAGDWVTLTVDDDGPGIPPEQRTRVFERFVRLDDARARDNGGAGLGLSLVRAIVGRHGGTVAAGAAPGGGARLEVRLPAAPR